MNSWTPPTPSISHPFTYFDHLFFHLHSISQYFFCHLFFRLWVSYSLTMSHLWSFLSLFFFPLSPPISFSISLFLSFMSWRAISLTCRARISGQSKTTAITQNHSTDLLFLQFLFQCFIHTGIELSGQTGQWPFRMLQTFNMMLLFC